MSAQYIMRVQLSDGTVETCGFCSYQNLDGARIQSEEKWIEEQRGWLAIHEEPISFHLTEIYMVERKTIDLDSEWKLHQSFRTRTNWERVPSSFYL